MEKCIFHILKRHFAISEHLFKDIKDFYDKKIHPDVLDLNDQKVYEKIFHQGNWAATFQFSEMMAQNFCKKFKPSSIEDLSIITSIMRPRSNGK